jgi:ABC-type dipeptide/oligopeptide/nickel transport system ATPase component
MVTSPSISYANIQKLATQTTGKALYQEMGQAVLQSPMTTMDPTVRIGHNGQDYNAMVGYTANEFITLDKNKNGKLEREEAQPIWGNLDPTKVQENFFNSLMGSDKAVDFNELMALRYAQQQGGRNIMEKTPKLFAKDPEMQGLLQSQQRFFRNDGIVDSRVQESTYVNEMLSRPAVPAQEKHDALMKAVPKELQDAPGTLLKNGPSPTEKPPAQRTELPSLTELMKK